jgi:hypothetical protein
MCQIGGCTIYCELDLITLLQISYGKNQWAFCPLKRSEGTDPGRSSIQLLSLGVFANKHQGIAGHTQTAQQHVI